MKLLEREHVRSVLDDLVAGAIAGAGTVAVMSGPPGIGKTALLADLRDRVGATMRVLTSIGGELEHELPFGVVRQLFEPTVGARPDEPGTDPLVGVAGSAAPVFAAGTTAPTATLGEVVYGLYWLCADLADTTPLLICVDDVHWADDASLRFLSHLARRITALPIVLLVSGRAGAVLDDICLRAFGGVEVVTLQPAPLSDAGVTTFVRQRLGDDAHEAFCAACALASGGNPFLLTEALTSLESENVRPIASEVARVAHLRPQTISRVVLSRIAHLGPDAVRVARALAILGSTSQLSRLAEFAGLPADRVTTVADLLAREAIVTDGWPTRFVHPLVHEAVHGDLSALQRASEHKRAARLLAADGADPEQIAAHLLATEPEADSWVVATLRTSSAAAIARGAPESAIALLTRARTEPAGDDDRAPVDAELARAYGMAARVTDAATLLHEAIDHSAHPTAKLVLALELVLLVARAGRGQEAVDAVALARQFIEWDDPELPVALQAILAATGLAAHEPPSVWLPRLDRLAPQIDDTLDLGRTVLSLIAFGAAVVGDRPAAEVVRLARRVTTVGVPLSDGGIGVNMTAAALAIAGHESEALDVFDHGLDNARARGDVSTYRYLAAVRSRVASAAGRLAEAEADAHSALGDVAGEVERSDASLAATMLVSALVDRGAITEAAAVLEEYVLPDEDSEGTLIESFAPMARGALRQAQRRPAQALAHFLKCGQMLNTVGYSNPAFAEWRAGAVVAHLALGQTAEAGRLADENLALARSFAAPRSVALALRTAARAGSKSRRLDYLAEAGDLLADSSARLEHAHVLVEYGTELARIGKRDKAITQLRDGLDLAAGCDARPLAATARKELGLLGLKPRRAAVTGRAALTPSELRVAGLAAEGVSNREIAQSLFVTSRTVEVHLTSAYRKLNIQARGELRTALGGLP